MARSIDIKATERNAMKRVVGTALGKAYLSGGLWMLDAKDRIDLSDQAKAMTNTMAEANAYVDTVIDALIDELRGQSEDVDGA